MTVARARWLVVAVLVAAAASSGGWIATHLAWLRPLVPGRAAPALVLPVVAPGPARTVDLAAWRGEVVVVEFWATWCGPCLRAMPHLDRAARRWGDRVKVIAVVVDDAARARELFDDAGYQLTLVADDGEVSQRYGVTSYPRTVVIDRAGVVVTVTAYADVAIAAVDRLVASSLP